MSKVPNPLPPMNGLERRRASVAADLARLRADYPDWAITHLPSADHPFEARRRPSRWPTGGGFSWITAPSPERLGDLIGGALQVEAQAAAEGTAR